MSDEQSTTTATDDPGAADETDSTGSPEPGGGPQRVVSDESVDDILESLDSTNSESSESDDTAVTTSEPSDSATAAFDEDDIPAVDETTADDAGQPEAEPTTATTDDTTAEGEPETETETADAGSNEGSNTTDAATVDAAASSLPDDASLEDLAARVEDGTVTGADVRASEAGADRESTPEIDDVDLSMNDLEMSQTGRTDADEELPDDAGPLAGSVDRDAAPASSDDEDKDDSPGLLGRFKRFFSR
ncbi:hypothetical protein [Natrinema sp. SYSU A 869]|uniref:hypothetical protein n=1 Tax=Natrinema sp. SYSU A 869 TaxID=2871694 RepID=UPI001CA3E821|nr:hypothetical protein [Natrinema sp. SYSU A 869]